MPHLAGDEPGAAGRQEQQGLGDLLGFAETLQRQAQATAPTAPVVSDAIKSRTDFASVGPGETALPRMPGASSAASARVSASIAALSRRDEVVAFGSPLMTVELAED